MMGRLLVMAAAATSFACSEGNASRDATPSDATGESDAGSITDDAGADVDDGGNASTACEPDSPPPHAPGIPYLGVHANPQNNDRVACATAGAWSADWHVLQGRAVGQPNTFSPDGMTTYVTTSAPDGGCSVYAVDVATAAVDWCVEAEGAVVGSVAVDDAGDLFFATYDGVVSLTADGTERWRRDFALPDGSLAGPTGVHLHPLGHVAAAAGNGDIALVDRATGDVVASLNAFDDLGLPRLERAGLGLDLGALLPAPVVDDFATTFGGFGALLNLFTGVGATWTDNTISIAPDGTLYALGSGASADEGALVQVHVRVDGDDVSLDAGWLATYRGGSASTPSISPDGRHVKITDGNGPVGLLTPSRVDANALIFDIGACDANTDGADAPSVCAPTLTVPLRTGPSLGASPLLDELEHYVWEVQFAGLFDHSVPDLIRYAGADEVWTLDLPDDAVWSSVLTISDNHIIGTATRFTPSDARMLTIALPATATSEVVAVDRATGDVVFAAPITDDSTSTVTVGPDGALYVTQLGLLSGFAVDTTITGGMMRFSPQTD